MFFISLIFASGFSLSFPAPAIVNTQDECVKAGLIAAHKINKDTNGSRVIVVRCLRNA